MDKKLLSTAVIIIVVIASMGAVIAYDEALNSESSSGADLNIIARVNTEGSGIYIDKDILSERGGVEAFYTNDSGYYTVSETNKAAWGGLIVGTPGAATIQHVQMQQLVEEMGLIFTLYQIDVPTDNNHVYYIVGMNNATVVLNTPLLDMGILWEPQYTSIVDSDKFVSLGLTNNFFPGHTCCVITGETSFMNSNPDVTERFLVAYINGVNYVTEALEQHKSGASQQYEDLVALAMAKTGITNRSVVEDALGNITYTYADENGDLANLKIDIANLAKSLPGLSVSTSDLGFTNVYQFANTFVDDSFIIQAAAAAEDGEYEYTGGTRNITVACIAGDIHQIALHVSIEQGYFSDCGLNVNVSAAGNGPAVATALQNGEAQFGFLGAPPITSTVINGELVRA